MRIEVIPIDFMGQPPLYEPKERELFDMAIEYCNRELAEQFDFVNLNKVWVSVICDDEGKPQEVIGITGTVLKADIPIFRVSGPNAKRATKMLEQRLHSYFADQGMRGHEVFLHISSKETPEQKCPAWEESLLAAKAVPADRFSVIVR